MQVVVLACVLSFSFTLGACQNQSESSVPAGITIEGDTARIAFEFEHYENVHGQWVTRYDSVRVANLNLWLKRRGWKQERYVGANVDKWLPDASLQGASVGDTIPAKSYYELEQQVMYTKSEEQP